MKKPVLFGGIALFALLFAFETSVPAQANRTSSKKPSETVSAKQTPAVSSAKTNITYLSPLEREIIAEINLVRTNPKLYITYLEEFRKFYDGKNLTLPNQRTIVTNEGAAALDDAVKALKSVKSAAELQSSEFITKATREHLDDLIKNSSFGHNGSDGSMPDTRLNRYIYAETIRFGENIVMSGLSARDVVITMLIDDGFPSRAHRKNVLDAEFKFIGLSNGVNKTQNGLSVIIFATDAKEKTGGKSVAGKPVKQVL